MLNLVLLGLVVLVENFSFAQRPALFLSRVPATAGGMVRATTYVMSRTIVSAEFRAHRLGKISDEFLGKSEPRLTALSQGIPTGSSPSPDEEQNLMLCFRSYYASGVSRADINWKKRTGR